MQDPTPHLHPKSRTLSEGQPLARWLEAERAERTEEAERNLFNVFAALPEAVPSQGFAERVLMAAGVPAVGDPAAGVPAAGVPAATVLSRPWSRVSRLALAACLVSVAVSSAFLLPAALELLALLTPTELVTGLVDGSRALGNRLHDLSPLWQLATTLYGTVLHIVASPPVLALLLSLTLLSSAGLRSLLSLLPTRRSVGYA